MKINPWIVGTGLFFGAMALSKPASASSKRRPRPGGDDTADDTADDTPPDTSEIPAEVSICNEAANALWRTDTFWGVDEGTAEEAWQAMNDARGGEGGDLSLTAVQLAGVAMDAIGMNPNGCWDMLVENHADEEGFMLAGDEDPLSVQVLDIWDSILHQADKVLIDVPFDIERLEDDDKCPVGFTPIPQGEWPYVSVPVGFEDDGRWCMLPEEGTVEMGFDPVPDNIPGSSMPGEPTIPQAPPGFSN